MRNLLQPWFAAALTSDRSFQLQRVSARTSRRAKGTQPTVEWFHRLDDAHSVLLGQALEQIRGSYDVQIVGRTVSPTPDSLAPQAELLRRYAARDARQIAPHYGLKLGNSGPEPRAVEEAHASLTEVEGSPDYVQAANKAAESLWSGAAMPGTTVSANPALEPNRRRLHRLGHYQSGMLYFDGEWYFGVDRLPLLLNRLKEEGLGPAASHWRPEPFFSDVPPPPKPAHVELFYSARSPYSYLALRRALDIAESANVPLKIRPMLPMVMRGEPVPRVKRFYLVRDAAREARRHGIPFGRIRDPVGSGVERVLAVFVAARTRGLPALRFLERAATAIWSEGVEVAGDRGLRAVCEDSGISWEFATEALRDESWRTEVAVNQRALLELGHWGVPTFRVGEQVLWGQDRLWLLKWLVSGDAR